MTDISLPQSQLSRPWISAAAVIVAAGLYSWALLMAEETWQVLSLLVLAVVATGVAIKTGFVRRVERDWAASETRLNRLAFAVLIGLILVLSGSHFALLMISTVLLYFVASLGLNIQFGFTGLVNFAGAAFFGAGAYTAAVLGNVAVIPPLLILLAGGIVAMAISLPLLIPIVRTTGHYAAVVTIAFGVLFRTFLEVNEILGGPQGLMVNSMKLFGWDFYNAPSLGNLEISFYVNYALLAAGLAALVFVLFRRLERSWIGLHMDAVRLDETAAACFGISVKRTKILAFLLGNVILGVSGALYGMMISFIAPASFTFSDSLLLVSIVLLGGLGSPWGGAIAAAIVVLLPEKLQLLQEYRFLLFSILVMLVLLFRPEGILPRHLRNFFPNRRTDA
ncbi:MAG: branched-chain amino acid ABC transporter permease [Thioclava marina]|uniref:branched-chain amino acid ABC transporter permease n=1 Tax=Thioclava TaxID=285107 RepID=UPI0009961384|nr:MULTISPECIES: branched-chain amino acid ABC transporter permease [Thioclava]MBC7145449.1 branched-chain amino acid ABC transporter permease [Thioclava marina]MBD3802434.1 branched-chain amino acid ABC transporter permease [Thioclava sp.]TNE92976.1 MAG: branched-chain amino acid ABC transporter permease [Paracoccaceae bacterium]